MSLEGVSRVIGGVGSDHHIRALLQPRQQLMRKGPSTVVGVEHSFLVFDDVQSGAAEMAALQRGEKCLGIEQCTACRIDDEGALAHVRHASTIEKMMGVRSQWCVERHHVALPQQHVKRHILGRRRATTVTGQYAAAEPPQPVHHGHADASCPHHPDGHVAELFSRLVVQPVIVNLGTTDAWIWHCAAPSASTATCSRPRCRASRRHSRRRCRRVQRSPGRCGRSRRFSWRRTARPLGPAREAQGPERRLLWPMLTQRFPEASSMLASETAASVRVGAAP